MDGPKHVSLEKFFADVGRNYDHLVIAEQHFGPGNEKLYDNPDFYKGLKDGGFHGLGTELPVEIQPAIDAYYNRDTEYFHVRSPRDIKPENLYPEFAGYGYRGRAYDHKDVSRQLATQIENARAQGLTVVAIDDKKYPVANEGDAQRQYVKKIMDEKGITEDQLRTRSGLDDLPEIDPYDFLAKSVKAGVAEPLPYEFLDREQITTLEKMNSEAVSRDRLEGADPLWHHHLDENFPDGTKTVSIVGIDHPWNVVSRPGIDELLGGDKKAATIMLVENEGRYKELLESRQGYKSPDLHPPTDEPHAVLFTDTMTLRPGDKLNIPGYTAGEDVQLTDQPETPALDTKPVPNTQPSIPAPPF